MSKVSTSSVVSVPSASIWDRKASSSVSCRSVHAWAAVPIVGMPQRRPAARLLVAVNPAMYAARAAAIAESSPARREPISARGRSPAATLIRAAADAIAESWLSTDRTRVSSTTASANVPSTVRIGEPGKYSSPSRYPVSVPVKR